MNLRADNADWAINLEPLAQIFESLTVPQLTAVGKMATKVVRKIKLLEEVDCIETAHNPFFKLFKHLDLVVDSESSELLQQLGKKTLKIAK